MRIQLCSAQIDARSNVGGFYFYVRASLSHISHRNVKKYQMIRFDGTSTHLSVVRLLKIVGTRDEKVKPTTFSRYKLIRCCHLLVMLCTLVVLIQRNQCFYVNRAGEKTLPITCHFQLPQHVKCDYFFFTHCWEREKKNEPHSSRQTNESTIYLGCNTMCSPFSHSIIVFNEFDKFFGTNSLRRSTRELNRVKPTGVCVIQFGGYFFALN